MKAVRLALVGAGVALILIHGVRAQDSLNVTRLGSIYAQVDDGEDIAVAGNYAYVASYEGMAVIDVSDPQTPTLAGFCGYQGYGEGIALQESYAYVAANFSGLHIINIANPASPEEVGSYCLPEYNRGVAVSGEYAYVANHYEGMSIIDVSNPANPVQVGFFDPPGTLGGVAVSGDYAFLAALGAGVRVVDVSNPHNPVEVSIVNTPGGAQGITISGSYAYVADGTQGLRIVNITNPLSPVLMGGLTFGSSPFISEAFDVAVSGQYAYVGVGGTSYTWQNGLRVVNISDPWFPALVGQCNDPLWTYGVAVSGTHAYVCGAFTAVLAIDIAAPFSPIPQGYYSVQGKVYDLKCQGDFAYIADTDNGFRIVNVADPSAPQEVGCLPAYFTYLLDIKGDYAYMIEGKGGLLVADISIPSAPNVLGSCFGGWYAQDIVAYGEYVYVADLTLRVNDVSDPANPTFVGNCTFNEQLFGVTISGAHAFVTTDGYLRTVDVTDPTNPVEISSCGNLPGAKGVALTGDYVYVACGVRGLHVVNVSDPINPVEVGWCDTPGDAQRVNVCGNLAFVADTHQGLRVIDVSNPSLPIEVAYYDTPGLAQELSLCGSTAFVAEGYCLGIYEFIQPSITVSLIPFVSPVLIPASGGSFDFYLFASNNGPGNQAVDLWSKVILPGGSVLSPIIGPVGVLLNPGTTGWYRRQNVPASAPPGEYTYIACAGAYPGIIWNSDSLEFTKLATGDWGPGPSDWFNTGEPFLNRRNPIVTQPVSPILSVAPNPFNPTTTISYQLPADGHVSLKVFDVSGRLVARLVDGGREAGTHEVTFDGSGLPSGVYLCRLEAGDYSTTEKMVLMK